ncbi:uncharacterized protein LOC143001471 [Genypterus blacodes]|uniref:uncharacterized protein LOC143001471 n=1 Tax=Genypterus blacodes TaxID=154954 RepID=UPI003F76164C
MMSFEDLITIFQDCRICDDQTAANDNLERFIDKLTESSRCSNKRIKERCLDEAVQLLRQIPDVLEEHYLLLVVRVLISLQLQMVSISTASRKLDQMLQHVAKVDHQLVFREIHHCLTSIVDTDQILSIEDLQRACTFLEDSTVGREAWRVLYPSLLNKLAEFLPIVLQQDSLRDGPLCYIAVKVCLQMFQLLPGEVGPLVWDKGLGSPAVQQILQSLMDIILGQCCNRDTRLLAGTAVTMLINTSTDSRTGGAAAFSLLQVFHPGMSPPQHHKHLEIYCVYMT